MSSHLHCMEKAPQTVGDIQVSYDLLVGADGSRSAVRSALQQIMPSTYIQRYRHSQVYCSGPVTGGTDSEVTKHASFEAHPLLKVCTCKSCYLAMPVHHSYCYQRLHPCAYMHTLGYIRCLYIALCCNRTLFEAHICVTMHVTAITCSQIQSACYICSTLYKISRLSTIMPLGNVVV